MAQKTWSLRNVYNRKINFKNNSKYCSVSGYFNREYKNHRVHQWYSYSCVGRICLIDAFE